MTERVPPQDNLAEVGTLGGILLAPSVLPDVLQTLKGDEFYKPAHELIFQAVSSLHHSGEPVDAVTVMAELERRGQLKKVGGAPYIHTLIEQVPSPANAPYYAKQVARKAKMRHLIETGVRLQQLGYGDTSGDEEVDEALAQAGRFLREVDGGPSGAVGFSDLITKWREWQDSDTGFIPTPWPELNRWLPGGGLHPGTVTVVGGRPGSGKSNAGLNIALGAAELGVKTTVFSMEMDDVEVLSRVLAAGSYSPFSQIIGRKMERETWHRVEEYIDSHKDLPLEIVDQASLTVEQVVAHCRAHRPELIFVDYAQLMHSSNPRWERKDAVRHITRSLKVAAKELGMAAIEAAQLNREPAKGNKAPGLQDLAESDAIGQDADLVLLLSPAEEGIVRLHCAKNRNGRTGMIELVFRGGVSRVG